MRFLAIGECMAELSPRAQGGDYRLGFAGDTFNTAWYLARTAPEVGVSYFTAVGDDATSGEMRRFIRASGIDDTHVQVLPGETIGLYLIHLENGERSFSYWRAQSAARQLAKDVAALDRAIATSDVVYFSGITLAILDPSSRDVLMTALARGRAQGKTIAFDTNLRPRLWADTQTMCDAVTAAASQADIVLPSFDDEADWFGDATAEETLARYLSLGAPTVIVKNSAQSVIFEERGQRGETVVEQVASVVDTTAAGDSFNAGVLAAVLRGEPLPQGIAAGCRLAARVVGERGALVDL